MGRQLPLQVGDLPQLVGDLLVAFRQLLVALGELVAKPLVVSPPRVALAQELLPRRVGWRADLGCFGLLCCAAPPAIPKPVWCLFLCLSSFF